MGDAMVGIRMNKEIKKQLEEYALLERRSLSNFMLNAALEHVERQYSKVIKYKVKEK